MVLHALQQCRAAVALGAGRGTGSAGGGAVEVPFEVLVDAARRAACVAALSVTKKGTQSSYAARSSLPPALFQAAPWGEAEVEAFEAWARAQ